MNIFPAGGIFRRVQRPLNDLSFRKPRLELSHRAAALDDLFQGICRVCEVELFLCQSLKADGVSGADGGTVHTFDAAAAGECGGHSGVSHVQYPHGADTNALQAADAPFMIDLRKHDLFIPFCESKILFLIPYYNNISCFAQPQTRKAQILFPCKCCKLSGSMLPCKAQIIDQRRIRGGAEFFRQ
jgi:hypothetical protein